MSMPSQSRREFLASITAAGAASLVAPRGVDARTIRRSFGANDRIRIGIIGIPVDVERNVAGRLRDEIVRRETVGRLRRDTVCGDRSNRQNIIRNTKGE